MLELVAAKQQDRDLVARLEQLYSYDFSAFTDCALSPDGVFPAVKSFREIWKDPELFTFILCAKTEPAGLAIVRRLAHEAYDMEQFFCFRKILAHRGWDSRKTSFVSKISRRVDSETNPPKQSRPIVLAQGY